MAFNILRDDLSRAAADAVVLPSNEQLRITGGVGLVIAQIAGLDKLQAACDVPDNCPVGQAVATEAFDFPARHLIHAVGPEWEGGNQGEAELLRATYDSALELAESLGCKSVALPLISAGTYGFPPEQALGVAIDSIRAFCLASDVDVTLYLFDRKAYSAGEKLLGDVAAYINDHYAESHSPSVYRDAEIARRRPVAILGSIGERVAGAPKGERPAPANAPSAAPRITPMSAPMPAPRTASVPAPVPAPSESLADLLGSMDEPFSVMLMHLIDDSGLTDAQVYHRANMSRQLFSKIRSNPDYRPTKKTVLSLCIALELNLAQTSELLNRAGYGLSHASKFDVIVEYFIVKGNYDVFSINEVLFSYDQPLLG